MPDEYKRASVLARTGHGFLDDAPTVLGSAAVVAVVALTLRAAEARRGQTVIRRVLGVCSTPAVGVGSRTQAVTALTIDLRGVR